MSGCCESQFNDWCAGSQLTEPIIVLVVTQENATLDSHLVVVYQLFKKEIIMFVTVQYFDVHRKSLNNIF